LAKGEDTTEVEESLDLEDELDEAVVQCDGAGCKNAGDHEDTTEEEQGTAGTLTEEASKNPSEEESSGTDKAKETE